MMPYCPRCGVEVDNSYESCPLCHTKIPAEVREKEKEEPSYPDDVIPPRPMYRKMTPRQVRIFVISIVGLSFFLPIIASLMVDIRLNGTITWSYYIYIPLILIAGIVYFYLKYPKKPLIAVNATFFILILIDILLEFRGEPGTFFTSINFSIIFSVLICGEVILLFLTSHRRRWFNIVSVSLLSVSLLLFMIEFIVGGIPGWSLITGSVILPSSLLFYYIGAARYKGLNIIGFSFILLTLMLLGLDVFTGFSGWSIVTTVIFGFLSLMFYVMHIVFFNDTDWRKALHL